VDFKGVGKNKQTTCLLFVVLWTLKRERAPSTDEQQEKKSISINIDARRAEKIDRQHWALKTENKRRTAKSLEIFQTFEDLEEFNENKEDIDIDLQNDYLLNEGTLILSDYIYLNTQWLLSEAA